MILRFSHCLIIVLDWRLKCSVELMINYSASVTVYTVSCCANINVITYIHTYIHTMVFSKFIYQPIIRASCKCNIQKDLRRTGRHDIRSFQWLSFVSYLSAITMRLYTLWKPNHGFWCIVALGKSHSHAMKTNCQHLHCKRLMSVIMRRWFENLTALSDLDLWPFCSKMTVS